MVQNALAQLSGVGQHQYSIVPIAFSFGWVSYAFSAICAVFGDFVAMPKPDCDCKVINADSKQGRDNRSWVLGRLVRDQGPTVDAALTIEIYDIVGPRNAVLNRDGTVEREGEREGRRMGVATKDWVYWFGCLVIVVQLGVACIPGALFGHWLILVLTAAGTILAQAQSWLPQWRKEKWSSRPLPGDKTRVTCLTRGNGSRMAIVIVSNGVGLRLEDMAAGYTAFKFERTSAIGTIALAVLWIAHLITIQSLNSGAETWVLLAIGALGMVQNSVAAGAKRSPGALGLHLQKREDIIQEKKVLWSLKRLEDVVPTAGMALVETFFPGGVRDDERALLQDPARRLPADRNG